MTYAHCDIKFKKTSLQATITCKVSSKKGNTSNRHYNQSNKGQSSSSEHIIDRSQEFFI